MNQPKSYFIGSLAEILRAVDAGNKDEFMYDFADFLASWVRLRTIHERESPEMLDTVIDTMRFAWVDDAKKEFPIKEMHVLAK